MRLFIALPVTAALRQTLTDAQAALRRQGARGRFTPPNNLHMTLTFLGSVDDPAPAIEAMQRVNPPRGADLRPADAVRGRAGRAVQTQRRAGTVRDGAAGFAGRSGRIL